MANKKILLIDDDAEEHEIFLMAVEQLSGKISGMAMDNARLALQKLTLQEIRPDVILLDLNMPIMTGQQFLIEIKKNEILKDIPVFIYSTSSHKATIDLMLLLGAQDFITKPDKQEEMVEVLELVIAAPAALS
ncbi:MAG TPA: response regulator [Cytophagaceae bacterium]|nr:response regulator [Cytophagaceae bacterium]